MCKWTLSVSAIALVMGRGCCRFSEQYVAIVARLVAVRRHACSYARREKAGVARPA